MVPELPAVVSTEAVPGLDSLSNGRPKAVDVEIDAFVSSSVEQSPPKATQTVFAEPKVVPDSGVVVMVPAVDQTDVEDLEGSSEVPLEPINTQSTLKMRSELLI